MSQAWVARAAVFFASLSAALLIALLLLAFRGGGVAAAALQGSRRSAIERMVQESAGVFDVHSDPWVSRVMLPNLRGRAYAGAPLYTNDFGMRERYYELPKPAGRLRIVVLGDSLVFGQGCPHEQRMGVFLEAFLRLRSLGPPPDVEVLHLAIPSWNIVAECEFVRRQLSLLQPDVVFHFTTNNDTDDLHGVRGFGEKARIVSLHRERCDARVESINPAQVLGMTSGTGLIWGADWESRERLRESREAVLRLRDAVEEQGGRYVMVLHWGICSSAAGTYLIEGLAEDQVASLPSEFWDRRQYWVAEDDPHWNPEGMRVVGELLYALVRERGLVPGLRLAPSADGAEVLALVEGQGRVELGWNPVELGLRANPLDARVDLTRLSQELPSHFHGGLDLDARIGPYACIALLNQGATRLAVRGAGLDRPEIDGLTLRVLADEVLLAELTLRTGEPFEGEWELPEELLSRPAIDARFEANDFAYVGPDLQHCVSARLDLVELR